MLNETPALKVTGYKIVRGKANGVEREVEEYIKQGYELNGPLRVLDADGTTIFVQGLVKYDKTS